MFHVEQEPNQQHNYGSPSLIAAWKRRQEQTDSPLGSRNKKRKEEVEDTTFTLK